MRDPQVEETFPLGWFFSFAANLPEHEGIALAAEGRRLFLSSAEPKSPQKGGQEKRKYRSRLGGQEVQTRRRWSFALISSARTDAVDQREFQSVAVML